MRDIKEIQSDPDATPEELVWLFAYVDPKQEAEDSLWKMLPEEDIEAISADVEGIKVSCVLMADDKRSPVYGCMCLYMHTDDHRVYRALLQIHDPANSARDYTTRSIEKITWRLFGYAAPFWASLPDRTQWAKWGAQYSPDTLRALIAQEMNINAVMPTTNDEITEEDIALATIIDNAYKWCRANNINEHLAAKGKKVLRYRSNHRY